MALRPHVAPELLNKVTKALGITALDQWYHVTHHAASKAIGARALNNFGGSVVDFLKAAYPQHHFDEEKLTSSSNLEKDQKFAEVLIRKLFPNDEVQTKARKAVGIMNPETGAYLEIDFWIPSLKLGIEYQDKHHYEYQWYANSALEDYKKRDELKKVTMQNFGYTLISIGYWWDKTRESLVATIRKLRPDLLQEYNGVEAEPIPAVPPPGFITAAPVIPGVTGIMSPFIPSANFDPTNWYAGEKHDGIRGIYNPELNKMFSRSGNELSIIPSLLNDIPDMLVEGEISTGRGNYNKTSAVSGHTQYEKVNWPMFRYVLYDIPDAELGNYTQRYSAITNKLMAHPFVFAQLAFRMFIASKSHLKLLVDSIINDAGEGVIVQKDAQYEYGRALGLAKIKLRRDADALVLHVNKLSCACKLVSGVTTDIVYCDDFNPSNLQVGDIISYYHNGFTKRGVPKRGEIYKVRYDLTWEQLLSDKEHKAVTNRSVKEAIGSRSIIPPSVVRKGHGHWNKSPNVRAYFDEYARTAGFDPLVPENWYPVKYTSFKDAAGGGLLFAYNFSIKKALSFAYPELEFEDKFKSRDKSKAKKGYIMKYGHWNKSPNVRAFFDQFAQTNGFDPLVADNWYPVKTADLRNAGGGGLFKAFKFNFRTALSHAYPELKFAKEKFKPRMRKGHWSKPTNLRAFFDEFARKSGFDPQVPNNWYQVKYSSLVSARGRGLFHYFSVMKAIKNAYPELEFDERKFRTQIKGEKQKKGHGHWKKATNVRAYFDEFARKTGFDPLVAENWLPVTTSTLRNAEGIGLLSAFKFNINNALQTAYPEFQIEDETSKRNFTTIDKT